jgi:hypothetical protein
VLGHLWKLINPSEPAAATTAVTPVVTTDVTAPDSSAETVPAVTTVVTTDVAALDQTTETDVAVTTEVTTAGIDPSRIISKWVERKPFPPGKAPPPGANVHIWPIDSMPERLPTAQDIAAELYAAMQRQPVCAGQWVLAYSIERVIYPAVCEQLGWPPRPWKGKKGVARHLAALSSTKYLRVEIDGVAGNLQHYYIAEPEVVTVSAMEGRRRTA